MNAVSVPLSVDNRTIDPVGFFLPSSVDIVAKPRAELKERVDGSSDVGVCVIRIMLVDAN